ncbi:MULTISPECIES: hypothetical protein [unclassified Bartonella]|uniref:hypothetical protein n=1 Tax=unclassified Bartonella TaxID=2645622 RepID=UPI0001F4C64C|nr:hypothetical protein [Bartonella sp. AR 15-3]OPB32018.1 Surface antigen [Bartonella sp. AR 15-3]CBI78941.1 exported hypothetical protein [Bartonella sp. AR 15-3]
MQKVFLLLVGMLIVSLLGCSHTLKLETRDLNVEVEEVNSDKINGMGTGLLGSSFMLLSLGDRYKVLQAEYNALEYASAGKKVRWISTKRGIFGEVSAGQFYQVGSQNCRQYSHSFTLNGISEIVYGSACRNPDGSWIPLI